MNNIDKQYEWVSWETSTHYCISQWDVASSIKIKCIKKNEQSIPKNKI